MSDNNPLQGLPSWARTLIAAALGVLVVMFVATSLSKQEGGGGAAALVDDRRIEAHSGPRLWAVGVIVHYSPRLSSTLINFHSLLSDKWTIVLYTSADARKRLLQQKRLSALVESGRVMIELHPSDEPTQAHDLYKRKSFWERIQADKVLMWNDMVVLCSGATLEVDDFLEWDWVGAPWPWALNSKHNNETFGLGGNGAFSLRTRQLMLDVIDTATPKDMNEDMWFVEAIRSKFPDAKMAPPKVGYHFSIETWFNDATPVGVYHVMRTMKDHERSKVLDLCPEVRMLYTYADKHMVDQKREEDKRKEQEAAAMAKAENAKAEKSNGGNGNGNGGNGKNKGK